MQCHADDEIAERTTTPRFLGRIFQELVEILHFVNICSEFMLCPLLHYVEYCSLRTYYYVLTTRIPESVSGRSSSKRTPQPTGMPPKQAPDYLIMKRRQQEDLRSQYENFTRSNYKAEVSAEWEIRTAGVIENRQLKQRFDSIREQDQLALDARRRKLAEMLAHEHAVFQQQLEKMDETPAERKARMEARAIELKEKREQERLAFVRQQYERQWRLSCDPLREQESKVILKATIAARAYQIGEKMKQLEMEEQVELPLAN